MIYSDEINRVCGLCVHADCVDGDSMYCSKKRKNVDVCHKACRKFQYDIFKRSQKRRRKDLKAYSSSDFELV